MAKKWTAAEEKYLLENYGKVPMAELADRFAVTRKAISAKLDKLREAYGIDPVGARERMQTKIGKPVSVSQSGHRPPAPGGAIPRPIQLIETIKHPSAEHALPIHPPAGMVFTGNYVKTEKGWQPVYTSKERIKS
jgi:hypothetical protein